MRMGAYARLPIQTKEMWAPLAAHPVWGQVCPVKVALTAIASSSSLYEFSYSHLARLLYSGQALQPCSHFRHLAILNRLEDAQALLPPLLCFSGVPSGFRHSSQPVEGDRQVLLVPI